jgi:hypothetical protein
MTEFLSQFFTFKGGWLALPIAGFITSLSCILRYSPFIPEPEFPLKTPFGKLPFFDGIALYGVITFLLLGLARVMTLLGG